MICYKDQTFCSHECANAECHRNLTDAAMASARRWWEGCDGDPPINIADLKTDICGYMPRQ